MASPAVENLDFEITLVGLNHRTATIDVREKFGLASCASPENWALPCIPPLHESFILSTCNRVELLGIGKADLAKPMLAAWAKASSGNPADLHPYLYTYHNLEAVRHIFEVAASLDSMVLGEPQILGQMKAAYRNAVAARSAGTIINRILHKAFFVAKRVRHETAVASNAVSISYAAVELAKRIFGNMRSHKAMLIGAGEMAELAATHLLRAGVDQLIIANRTFENACALAAKIGGKAIAFEQLNSSLPDVDIVIASTGSFEPIINKEDIEAVLKKRKNSPMFLIDIAVPRDIDPAVNNIDNVYLYDIDDLKDVVQENMAARKDEADRAQAIIQEETANFGSWLKSLALQPTIIDMVRQSEIIAKKEAARTLKRLGSVSPEIADAVETMAFSLARKLMHEPLMFLKKDGMGRDDQKGRISLARKIFNLDASDDKLL